MILLGWWDIIVMGGGVDRYVEGRKEGTIGIFEGSWEGGCV